MKKSTKIIHSGRNPEKYSGNINVPIYQTSTINFSSLAELEKAKFAYGRYGTDTVFELAKLVADIENAHDCFFSSCGMSAITTAILSFVKSGDHILISDAAYESTKVFIEEFLVNYDISHSFYKVGNIDSIKSNYQENTKLIWAESPGSIFFAFDDLEELIKFAKEKKLISLIDNTWSAGHLLKPLDLGFDVSVQSASKYLCGHSDVMLGTISVANSKIARKVFNTSRLLGARVSPNDCFLLARGIRTLDVRLKEQGNSALEIAQFLEQHELIEKVYYPALPSHPHHARFKKYCTAANGILSFNFKAEVTIDAIRSFVDNLELFGIGYSWGGFESLVMLYTQLRGVDLTPKNGHVVRVNIGLESSKDLLNDISSGLDKITK